MSLWALYGICKVFLPAHSHIMAIMHTCPCPSFNIAEGASYSGRDSWYHLKPPFLVLRRALYSRVPLELCLWTYSLCSQNLLFLREC